MFVALPVQPLCSALSSLFRRHCWSWAPYMARRQRLWTWWRSGERTVAPSWVLVSASSWRVGKTGQERKTADWYLSKEKKARGSANDDVDDPRSRGGRIDSHKSRAPAAHTIIQNAWPRALNSNVLAEANPQRAPSRLRDRLDLSRRFLINPGLHPITPARPASRPTCFTPHETIIRATMLV